MKCPICQSDTQKGQKFCGGCGHSLQRVCSGCGTASPLAFQFCGQCGMNLTAVGTVVLDRAGIIMEADDIALDILAKPIVQVKGRPFSFFVALDDMVIYFSHWNELVGTSERQSMEIEIKTDKKEAVFAQIELSKPTSQNGEQYNMGIADATDRRNAQNVLQDKHDLINLVFSVTDDLEKAGEADRKLAISDILEKVCLFIGAEYSFLYRVNRPTRQLETYCQWQHPEQKKRTGNQPEISLASIRNILTKLQKKGTYTANDIKNCAANEHKELQSWQGINSGAILLQTIFRQKQPYGVIGVVKNEPNSWSQDTISLVKLVSKLVLDTMQDSTAAFTQMRPVKKKAPPTGFDSDISIGENELETMDLSDIASILGKPRSVNVTESEVEPDKAEFLPNGVKQPHMSFKPYAGGGIGGRMKVFADDDGNFRVTCPACRHHENVSPDIFAEMGFSLKATCHCSHQFPIMRERRTSFRKKVHLEGFYNQVIRGVTKTAAGPAWGRMVVKDLSKAGLSFTSLKPTGLRTGDPLLLQFNLDNEPCTLIKKNAVVKSVRDKTVGCQFEGSDRYDVSLGFYFI